MKPEDDSSIIDNLNQVINSEERITFAQLTTRYDSVLGTIWCWMHPQPRPCLSMALLDELMSLQLQLTNTYKKSNADSLLPFRHLVLASKVPEVFSLGGDLELFIKCVVNQDEPTLRNFAYKSVHLLDNNINNLELPVTMISLIQGKTLGGGFEMALSCDVVIAERSSKWSFPEILFNLFPSMGAYNLLTRRVGSGLAERIILSGKTYTASELYDMGVVDILAEDGEGVQATENYINRYNKSANTIRSIKKIRQMVHPIKKQDLYDIVDIWVNAVMALSPKNLLKMKRLLNIQELSKESKSNFAPRLQDWRKSDDIAFPITTHLGECIVQDRRINDSCRRR